MSFFTNLRADRLVTEVKSSTGPADATAQKAASKLKELGPGAIERGNDFEDAFLHAISLGSKAAR